VMPDISGVVRLGSPDDFGERILPAVLRRFAQTHPSIAVDVVIDQSSNLRKRMANRQLDLTLLTCTDGMDETNVQVIFTEPIVWAGAKGGGAHLREPLPLSIWEEGCAWRAGALKAMERDGRDYRIAYMSAHATGQRSAILSDLAIAPLPKSFLRDDLVELGVEDGLPEMGNYHIGMIVAPEASAPVQAAAEHIRAAFEMLCKSGRP